MVECTEKSNAPTVKQITLLNIEIGGVGERGPERSLKVFDYFVHLLNQTLILALAVLCFHCHFLPHTHT